MNQHTQCKYESEIYSVTHPQTTCILHIFLILALQQEIKRQKYQKTHHTAINTAITTYTKYLIVLNLTSPLF